MGNLSNHQSVAVGLPFETITFALDKVSNAHAKTYSVAEKLIINEVMVYSIETQVNECHLRNVVCVN
jgi:hypothetical protein